MGDVERLIKMLVKLSELDQKCVLYIFLNLANWPVNAMVMVLLLLVAADVEQ